MIELRFSLARADFILSVDLQLPARGITVLFGPSGCGKTSLLRSVAGLEPNCRGRVGVGDVVWQDDARSICLPTHRRPLGYVFQEASLFEHLDVQGNLRYASRRAGSGGIGLDEVIELLGIGHLMTRRPQELSGGERQRVAIARALATQPRLLLLDEPLAALDAARRAEVMPWLERLRDEQRVAMLYVTHSVDELVRLADQVVALRAGQVVAEGEVGEVLTRLDPPVLAPEDVGAMLVGEVVERHTGWHLARVAIEGGELWMRDDGAAVGQRVRLRILARDVSLALDPSVRSTIQNRVPGVIDAIVSDAHPSQQLVRVRMGPGDRAPAVLARITCRAAQELGLRVGQAVWAQIKSVALVR